MVIDGRRLRTRARSLTRCGGGGSAVVPGCPDGSGQSCRPVSPCRCSRCSLGDAAVMPNRRLHPFGCAARCPMGTRRTLAKQNAYEYERKKVNRAGDGGRQGEPRRVRRKRSALDRVGVRHLRLPHDACSDTTKPVPKGRASPAVPPFFPAGTRGARSAITGAPGGQYHHRAVGSCRRLGREFRIGMPPGLHHPRLAADRAAILLDSVVAAATTRHMSSRNSLAT
jgi:hypothetical protein